MLSAIRLLLFPFSVLYGLVIRLRHFLFDTGVFKSESFSVPVICVGNIALGGAGKTPQTEYLVRLLQPHYKVAILSRGYGRQTRGYICATPQSTAADIGDEPMQYLQKFPGVTVAVSERRAPGLRLLASSHDVVILDDAYQHRAVRPGYSLLLFDHNTLRRKQFLLPSGNLRDVFSARRRADLMVVTKLPGPPSGAEKQLFEAVLEPRPGQKIYYSGIWYAPPVSLLEEHASPLRLDAGGHALLLTGIANPLPLKSALRQRGWQIKHLAFKDHHPFDRKDLENIIEEYKTLPTDKKVVLTTEKDAQRLLDESLRDLLLNLPVYYIPIETAFFDEGESGFDLEILNYVKSAARDRRLH
ncbi:tetraacyldisaccharide 4'-kinase [Pedobacter yulinensis]|uniref:Tetraacyldisaccharide 4'-kinase n=1 Tax=Pedobacter yulinensis TaxID=2126353 RepID=A0A2T3HGP0_9SPHI|nr:tetraacyldisaccharide 4'-kinase [Pedobacter yulinensis]PST81614.1 tetraacyldisaccharide 4'-kinase [Pedobacter yulinensis]